MEEKGKGKGCSPGHTEVGNDARAAGDEEDVIDEIDARQWVREAMRHGLSPRHILQPLITPDCQPADDMDDGTLWRLLLSLLMTTEPRSRLTQYNTLDDAVQLINEANNIIVLTGAGISVSCGIPDFRSPQGLYATLHKEFPELPDPQAMFDIHYFNDDPRPFFRFCKEIYPGQFTPSPSHYFIAALERKGKLLRHYTQNIDTLEHTAGITRVVYCHGSFATASCCKCHYRVDCDAIRQDIMKQEVPLCPKCMEMKDSSREVERDEVKEEEGWVDGEGDSDDDGDGGEVGVMKPDIVFFGEGLPDEFHHTLEEDKTKVDLLIVMGSSLKVRPVALIPSVLEGSVPQLLINRESLTHMMFDIQLLGYSDTIVGELCHRLGSEWTESVGMVSDQKVVTYTTSPVEHIHIFPGAVWNNIKTTTNTSNVNHSIDDITNNSTSEHTELATNNETSDLTSELQSNTMVTHNHTNSLNSVPTKNTLKHSPLQTRRNLNPKPSNNDKKSDFQIQTSAITTHDHPHSSSRTSVSHQLPSTSEDTMNHHQSMTDTKSPPTKRLKLMPDL